jgi:hypothetical protein
MDSMLIYNRASLADPSARGKESAERIASIQWSRSGQQCVLYLDGTAQAHIDFATHTSFCRSNFPNFLDEDNSGWRKSSHAWDESALQRFESSIYA